MHLIKSVYANQPLITTQQGSNSRVSISMKQPADYTVALEHYYNERREVAQQLVALFQSQPFAAQIVITPQAVGSQPHIFHVYALGSKIIWAGSDEDEEDYVETTLLTVPLPEGKYTIHTTVTQAVSSNDDFASYVRVSAKVGSNKHKE